MRSRRESPTINFRLDAEVQEQAYAAAAARGLSPSQYVRSLLNAELARTYGQSTDTLPASPTPQETTMTAPVRTHLAIDEAGDELVLDFLPDVRQGAFSMRFAGNSWATVDHLSVADLATVAGLILETLHEQIPPTYAQDDPVDPSLSTSELLEHIVSFAEKHFAPGVRMSSSALALLRERLFESDEPDEPSDSVPPPTFIVTETAGPGYNIMRSVDGVYRSYATAGSAAIAQKIADTLNGAAS